MTRVARLGHEFVEFIPDALDDGTLYVSMKFGTVVHRCCCGCGEQVVTPLSPTDWRLTFDGESISLHPSIGNWSFKCRSHYWIKGNRVSWAAQWSQEEVDAGRRRDLALKQQHFSVPSLDTSTAAETTSLTTVPGRGAPGVPQGAGWLGRLWRWLFGSSP